MDRLKLLVTMGMFLQILLFGYWEQQFNLGPKIVLELVEIMGPILVHIAEKLSGET